MTAKQEPHEHYKPQPKSKSVKLAAECPNCRCRFEFEAEADQVEQLKAGRLGPPYSILCPIHVEK